MRIGIIALGFTVQSLFAAPSPCHEQQPAAPVTSALRFFDALSAMDPDSSLRAVRTVPVSVQARERARATLPPEGALAPTRDEAKKLEALTPVLIYHERDQSFDIKIIDLPQAFIGLYERAILLISRPALKVLTASELQALGAHELAHDFFWGEFEQEPHGNARQQLELQCDGVAALTLVTLGLDPTHLLTATTKLNQFNERFGTPSNIADYPTPAERQRFINTLVREVPFSRTNSPKH
jgi:hypothetical protein